MMKSNYIAIRERLFSVMLGSVYVFFLYTHIQYFLQTGYTTTLLFVFYELFICVLVVMRSRPKAVSFAPGAWLAATIGTWLPLFFISNHGEFAGDIIFVAIQLLGICVSFLGMFSLNLSFGIVPANRGIKKSGMYKIVRHPIYAGYFLSLTCFVIQNVPDLESLIRNLSILVITLTALIFRIKFEEGFLSKDAEYRKLMKTTPYRLIPKVW